MFQLVALRSHTVCLFFTPFFFSFALVVLFFLDPEDDHESILS